jgi:NAD(P)-dependent dehydrogenase (short-subunit alcohol dehydrogenase family)
MRRSISRRVKRRVPLDGRVIAITGGARGLGLATATALTARGARLAIGDIEVELAENVAKGLPGEAVGLQVDVTDRDSFAGFLGETESRLGPLDVLINNAGIMLVGSFLEEEEHLTRREVDVNVHGVITGTRLALERMLPRRRGHIVNIASAAGKVPIAGEATYVATKHAVVGLTETLRVEYRHSGIDFSVVMPGLANTELASGMQAGRFVKLVEPEEVATAIVDALERRRFDVYVPRSLGGLIPGTLILPRALREAAARFFRTDKIATQIDRAGRQAYIDRTSQGISPERAAREVEEAAS